MKIITNKKFNELLGIMAEYRACYFQLADSYKKLLNKYESLKYPKQEGKIEVFKDKKKEWRFRIVSRNGRILCSSEGYKRRKDMFNGILALKKYAVVGKVTLIK